jgi:hypothetical protein
MDALTALIAMPLTVFVTGCVTLRSSIRSNFAARFVVTATLMAGGILAIVFVHMMAN